MFVSVESSGALTTVRVDRPPANAMSLELLDELVGTVEQLGAEPPSALVISGREGFFSAGVDLKLVPDYGPEQHRSMVTLINRMVLAVYGISCPVIAAVTGHAIAGGLVLALCADVRIASLDGRYGLTEVKVGVPYPQAAIGVVRAELPTATSRLLALSNRLVDGPEAVRLGIFDEGLPAADVAGRAIEIATELSSFPADVYATTKRELRGRALESMRQAVETEPLLERWLTA